MDVAEERGADCGATTVDGDLRVAWLHADGRESCDPQTPGRSFDAQVSHPGGRVYVLWEQYDGESGYSEVSAAQPPRVMQWHDDAYGCWMMTTGLGELPCLAGAPPPPPRVPWGRLLP